MDDCDARAVKPQSKAGTFRRSRADVDRTKRSSGGKLPSQRHGYQGGNRALLAVVSKSQATPVINKPCLHVIRRSQPWHVGVRGSYGTKPMTSTEARVGLFHMKEDEVNDRRRESWPKGQR
jgi:hypothetical protein